MRQSVIRRLGIFILLTLGYRCILYGAFIVLFPKPHFANIIQDVPELLSVCLSLPPSPLSRSFQRVSASRPISFEEKLRRALLKYLPTNMYFISGG